MARLLRKLSLTKARVVFLGTPEFARVHLEALLNSPDYDVVGVMSQPDRPAGRGKKLQASAVKKLAEENSIPVMTPEKVKGDESAYKWVEKLKAEIGVVVAFGQILPTDFIDLFPSGCVNVHASLLPRWRGAAPIQRAVEAGDEVTGVALQKLVKKLDAGDVIATAETQIEINESAMELHDRLAEMGAKVLVDALIPYIAGEIALSPQDEDQVTYAHKIDKSESLIDWKMPAKAIHNKIRGLQMGPGTYTLHNGKKIKIHRAEMRDSSGGPGEAVSVTESELVIGCGENSLSILTIQPESKPRMHIGDFLRGYSLGKGEQFGE